MKSDEVARCAVIDDAVGYSLDMSPTPSRDDLAGILGSLAVEMENQLDTETVLQTITASAVDIVPGVRWAGISLIQGRTVEARVPTDPLVTKLDALQSEIGEGPCITALRDHHTVHIDDMSHETRWPRFAEAALELGVHSSLSFQLFVLKGNFGSLNLYGGEPGVFDDESFLYGEILAQHASVAMAGTQAADQFYRALDSRDAIGQAKGIIMERFAVDDIRAFAMLTRLSQESNTKLLNVAKGVIATRNQG
ncbi:MAG: GAF and ANTAR domain-containing protein [Mycobacterium sp.]